MSNKVLFISFALLFGHLLAVSSQPFVGGHATSDPKISIYPNPAVEYIVIELDYTVNNVKFELNSMLGNKMIINPEKLGSGKYRISLKDFATGYYFLIVKDETTRFKKAYKFLKN